MELMFSSHIGPVLAMAELLSPCSAAPIGLQPFRFIAMDKAELRKLRAAIASSQKMEAESPSASPLAWIDTTESLNLTGLNNRKRSMLKIMVQLWSSNSFSVL